MNLRNILVASMLGIGITAFMLGLPWVAHRAESSELPAVASTAIPFTTLAVLPGETTAVDIHYTQSIAVGDLILLPNLRTKRMAVITVEHQAFAVGHSNELHRRVVFLEDICDPLPVEDSKASFSR